MSPKIAPYILSSPTSLHVFVDTALPVSTERSGGADAAHGLADDLVIQRRAHLVALVVHRTVSTNAEASRFFRRVNVRAQEEELPAVLLLLPLDHPPNHLVVVAAAGVLVTVGGDNEHRFFRHVLAAGVLVNVADVVNPYFSGGLEN